MDEQKTLTLTEVAKFIGVAKKTLYNWILDGRFPVKPIEGSNPRRWNIEDVENWRFGGKGDDTRQS